MIILRWKLEGRSNFGDALNEYLWPKLLDPAFAAVDGHFYGIGSILHNQPHPRLNVVFGAGAGYGFPPPADSTWRYYFVRGPRTSAAVHQHYVTDPGMLVRRFHTKSEHPKYPVSFMPRWDSVDDGMGLRLAGAGIHLINPGDPVESVLAEISDTELLLTEALHGAVCADAIRVPWISIYANRGHEYKWYDWCGSLGIVWNPIDAAEFTLAWARDFAVPQLSAASTLRNREDLMLYSLERLNSDIRGGKL